MFLLYFLFRFVISLIYFRFVHFPFSVFLFCFPYICLLFLNMNTKLINKSTHSFGHLDGNKIIPVEDHGGLWRSPVPGMEAVAWVAGFHGSSRGLAAKAWGLSLPSKIWFGVVLVEVPCLATRWG